jgi:hypothetical protein
MPAPTPAVDPQLYQYATVRQFELLEAIDAHGGLRPAAKALRLNYGAVRQALVAVQKKAAAAGYSPGHHLTRPVAPGFAAKGHSTLYRRGEDEPVLQWVKTQRDAEAQEALVREAVAALMQEVPRVRPTRAPAVAAADLCTVYTLTDSHVGMRAWGRETGADWDLDIAERVLLGTFQRMVSASPAAETGVVAQLGDYLHFDSLEAVTPTSHHTLDADSRYSKVIRVAVRLLRAVVQMALAKHRRVVLLIAEGNHDLAGSVWLRQMFALLFENEPRVTVIDSELPYYVHQHGQTMLGWHHGHLRKPDQLPALFAAQFPKIWGDTTKRYVHTGHQHHAAEKEHAGVLLVQHPTLAARDAYAARGGWISERQVTSITYHRRWGQWARHTVTPEMLEGEDAVAA